MQTRQACPRTPNHYYVHFKCLCGIFRAKAKSEKYDYRDGNCLNEVNKAEHLAANSVYSQQCACANNHLVILVNSNDHRKASLLFVTHPSFPPLLISFIPLILRFSLLAFSVLQPHKLSTCLIFSFPFFFTYSAGTWHVVALWLGQVTPPPSYYELYNNDHYASKEKGRWSMQMRQAYPGTKPSLYWLYVGNVTARHAHFSTKNGSELPNVQLQAILDTYTYSTSAFVPIKTLTVHKIHSYNDANWPNRIFGFLFISSSVELAYSWWFLHKTPSFCCVRDPWPREYS